ncbi:hypothetical protein HYV86_07275 [Candidatus Woesearchaeota archaeon]|nr:hypothetical protein [Candidatus Woesearchaeota archaeon]
MNKLIIFTLSLLLVVTAVYAQSRAEGPAISITLLSQTPDPVEPGQVVHLRFQVQNNGGQTGSDVVIHLREQYPFRVYGNQIDKNIGILRAGSDTVIVEYDIKVDEKAVGKRTEIELEARYDGVTKVFEDDEFLVDIRTQDPLLYLKEIIVEPKQVPPGETATVSIVVQNVGPSRLQDIRMQMQLENGSIPFAPYQGSSLQILKQLDPTFQKALTFSLIATPDAIPGLYKIPVIISYNDERANTTVVKDLVAVSVGDVPKVRPYIKKTTLLQAQSQGKVTFEIANAGATDVKYVEFTLLPSESYRLLTPSSYFYVGDIDADDTETEELSIYATDVQNVSIPIKLSYHDANNRPFQQEFTLELPLYSSRDLKKFGLVESGSGMIWAILIILGVGGYFAYKRFKKKKAKQ